VTVVVWLTEGTWEACVDAVPVDADDILLVYVAPAFADAELLGRGGHGSALALSAAEASDHLLGEARRRMRRKSRTEVLSGRPEHAVVAACEGASLLVLARDGDHSRLGPASLAPPTRFVVDHAPCRVLLVWPDEPPDLATIPPPPAKNAVPAKKAAPPRKAPPPAPH
jgi:nucleotide-binding universal stress UspA family protein